jgi:hypothetical protein
MRSPYAPQTQSLDARRAARAGSLGNSRSIRRQGPISPEELDAAVRRFKKAIIERAFGGELTHHLGYLPGGDKPDETTNHRNGSGSKTVLTDDGRCRSTGRAIARARSSHRWSADTNGGSRVSTIRFWHSTRILIAVTDGLKGMREALAAVFPQTTLQPVSCTSFGTVWISRSGTSASRWRRRASTSIIPFLCLPTGRPAPDVHDQRA